MASEANGDPGRVRSASCACGAVRATARGAPSVVNACACFNCQKRSGSAFTYTAYFPSDQVAVEGEMRTYREVREADRWHEAAFCVVCGVQVIARLEAFPAYIGVAVGCFSDPDFDPPGGFYWSVRRHKWLAEPMGVPVLEQQ